jgi:hypothetical protein
MRILENKVSVHDFIFAKEVRLGSYRYTRICFIFLLNAHPCVAGKCLLHPELPLQLNEWQKTKATGRSTANAYRTLSLEVDPV